MSEPGFTHTGHLDLPAERCEGSDDGVRQCKLADGHKGACEFPTPAASAGPDFEAAEKHAWLREHEEGSNGNLARAYLALRASLVEKVVGKVEGMERHEPCKEPVFGGSYAAMRSTRKTTRKRTTEGEGEWLYRADVLAVLRAELSEGRDK